jgi:large repetitive protein
MARDSNNLVTTCVTSVNVTDLERPIILCGNMQVPALANNSSALFSWSRAANATDNVAINTVRSVCSGGPINNLFPFGTPTTINCAAFDTSGNNNTCSYTITVVDRTGPVLSCPASATFNTSLNSNTRAHTFSVGVFDNVDGSSPTVTCSNPSGSQFLIGTTRVTCQAVDTAGNPGTCLFNVTVVDRQPPTLNCPAFFSPSSDLTTPSANILLNATATDNSLGPVTVVCTPGGLPAVYAFPLGTTPVNCVATDMFGNINTCSYPVIVVDRVPPVLNCPTVAIPNLPGRNFSNISSYPATATDNVNVTSFNCSPQPAGFAYPIGTTSVTCTASDARGNAQSCTFPVNVLDDESPVVTCPASFRNGTLNSTNITVTFPRAVASDNLAVTSSSLVVTFDQVDVALLPTATTYTFPTWGTAAFTYRAMDAAGHMGLCFWTVTIFDRTLGLDEIPPNITGCPTPFLYYTPPSPDFSTYPSNVTLWVFNTTQGKDSAVLTLAPLSATDNSGVPPTPSYLEWSVNPTSASLGLMVGQHVVAYSATDRVGNAAYCVYLIRVDDVIAPQFETCPSSTTLRTSNFRTTVNPVDSNYWPSTGIRFTDNFRITNRFGTCVSSPPGFCPPPGTPLNQSLTLGTYNFTYTATDDAGNAAIPCRFSLRIEDGDNPVLNGCPVSMSVPIQTPTDAGSATASIVNRCPNFTVTDNFPGSALVFSSSPLAGYNCTTPIPVVSPLVISVSGRDSSGRISNFCFLIVTVTDNDPPRLTGCSPAAPLIINAVCDPDQRTAVVWLPTITGTDNAGTVTLSLTSFPAGFTNGSAFNMGTTSLTMTATDPNRLTTQCSLEVRVRDTQPPVVLGFPVAGATTFSYNFTTDPDQPTYSFTPPVLTARDNVGIQSTSLTYEPAITNNNFPVGRTTLTFIAYDTSSLSSSVTIFVNVRDTQPPAIIGCPTVGNATPTVWVYNTSLNQPTAVVTWNTIYAQDNVDGEFPLSPTSNPGGFESGSPFRVGTTTITYQAIDVAGNINNCVFRVEVVDNQAPKITCPDNVTMITSSVDSTLAVLTWPAPIASDNYFLQPVEPNMFPNQNFSVGTYNITYVASDLAGNTNSCTFFATVLQFVPAAAASSSSSSAATFGAAGGAGALLLLLLLLVLIVILTRRRNKKVCCVDVA